MEYFNFEKKWELPLKEVQSIFGFIISVMSLGCFFFISNFVKIRALYQIKKDGRISMMKAIVPTNLNDIIALIRTDKITPIIVMVLLGLLLTNFDNIILVNTIDEGPCGTTTKYESVRITNDRMLEASNSYVEVMEMVNKRNKSGVSIGALTGHIPEIDNWRFNPKYDVSPYSWNSSCFHNKSEEIRVKVNPLNLVNINNLSDSFPEVHAKYKFSNGRVEFKIFHLQNHGTDPGYNGFLLYLLEEPSPLQNVDLSAIGSTYTNKLWTLRVPETEKIPLSNNIMDVPIFVEIYTCVAKRINNGNDNYQFHLRNLTTHLDVSSAFIGGKYLNAVIKGYDTSIYVFSPEYWASYLAVKDTLLSEVKQVEIEVGKTCIKIHYLYILLISVYIIMIILGGICWLLLTYNNRLQLPNNFIEWLGLACKESFIKINNGSRIENKNIVKYAILENVSNNVSKDNKDIKILWKYLNKI